MSTSIRIGQKCIPDVAYTRHFWLFGRGMMRIEDEKTRFEPANADEQL
jgi:hypothetical protein